MLEIPTLACCRHWVECSVVVLSGKSWKIDKENTLLQFECRDMIAFKGPDMHQRKLSNEVCKKFHTAADSDGITDH